MNLSPFWIKYPCLHVTSHVMTAQSSIFYFKKHVVMIQNINCLRPRPLLNLSFSQIQKTWMKNVSVMKENPLLLTFWSVCVYLWKWENHWIFYIFTSHMTWYSKNIYFPSLFYNSPYVFACLWLFFSSAFSYFTTLINCCNRREIFSVDS